MTTRNQIQGNWKQFRGRVQQHWGRLIGDPLKVSAGRRDSLAGKVQELYGLSEDDTAKQFAVWRKHTQTIAH